MGAKLSKCFMSREQQRTKGIVGSSSSDGKPSTHQGSSIIELMKPECLKTNKMVKKKPEKKIAKSRKLTLEDWLVASPGDPNLKPESFSGELHVFKQFSRRVHPSSGAGVVDEATTSRASARESLNLPVDYESSSMMSRSQSGKSKKKVSFKLPEEADIILFYSPDQEAIGSEHESC